MIKSFLKYENNSYFDNDSVAIAEELLMKDFTKEKTISIIIELAGRVFNKPRVNGLLKKYTYLRILGTKNIGDDCIEITLQFDPIY